MKKDGIYIMLLGLAMTIAIAFFYFTKIDQPFINKFVLHIGTSFHFNWAPMIGIFTMVFGEFVLWQSQYNKNLHEVMIKFFNKLGIRLFNLRLGLIYISHKSLLNMKIVRFIVSIFNI